jgi:isopenicillin-N epimerase
VLSRRELVSAVAQPASAMTVLAFLHPSRLLAAIDAIQGRSGTPAEIAIDESYWDQVQRAFSVDRSIVNLDNGGVSPSSTAVLEAQRRYIKLSNRAPAHTMWRVLEPQRETVRKELARVFGCDAEEVALTRNTSEGLETCQLGFDIKSGDEVLTTNQDYPRMITTFRQMERRLGVVLKQISIPTPPEDTDEVVGRFAAAITARTRLILVSHMICFNGNVLPVRALVALGRSRAIPVLVDGAHSFAHLPFMRADLDCDYYATSLHKWLAAPHGTGMLYVKRDRIRSLWPLMAAPAEIEGDIRKFEEIGTHPAAGYLAISEALALHCAIGAERKLARLRYLRDRWALRLAADRRVKLHTNLKPGLSGALATVEIIGVEPLTLADHLWGKHRIIVAPITHDEFKGIRVAPSVYTTVGEISRFVEAMEKVIAKGL